MMENDSMHPRSPSKMAGQNRKTFLLGLFSILFRGHTDDHWHVGHVKIKSSSSGRRDSPRGCGRAIRRVLHGLD